MIISNKKSTKYRRMLRDYVFYVFQQQKKHKNPNHAKRFCAFYVKKLHKHKKSSHAKGFCAFLAFHHD